MNVGRMFASAVVRKIAYILDGLLVYGILSVLGIGVARAQAATRSEAYSSCVAYGGPVLAYIQPLDASYTSFKCTTSATDQATSGIYVCNLYKGDTEWTTCYGIKPNYPYTTEFPWTQGCPTGSTWVEAQKDCSVPCNQKPALGDDQWTTATIQVVPGNPTVACMDGCGYNAPPNSILIQQRMDGVLYTSVTGWQPPQGTETQYSCPTGGAGMPGPLPADGDGDGSSDGNDPSPNNPGEGAPQPPAPAPGTCGGTGQPPCPSQESDPNLSTGGQNCQVAPSSSGDPILAQIAFQSWATRCEGEKINAALEAGINVTNIGQGGATDMAATNDLLGAIKNGVQGLLNFVNGTGPVASDTTGSDVTAASVYGETEIGASGFDDSGYGWNRACPAPIEVQVFDQTIVFNTDMLCNWLTVGGWFVLLLTGIKCIRTVIEA